MAVTFADLIAEVESFLHSYFADRDKVTSLVDAITASDLTLTVSEANLVDRGVIEIGDELLAVKSKDNPTNVVTVHPWGRGQNGTTAAAHAAFSKVTINPRFPRSWIKTEINAAISNLFPDLFKVASDVTNTVSPVQLTYPLPTAVEGVLAVAVETTGPSKVWQPVRRYHFNYNAATSEFPTGRTITLLDPCFTPGSTLQVVYRTGFSQLSADEDLLSDTGCEDSWRDLIKLQVASKMVLALESARLQTTSVEASARADVVQPGAAAQISRALLGQYQLRLDQERRLLLTRYPTVPSTR